MEMSADCIEMSANYTEISPVRLQMHADRTDGQLTVSKLVLVFQTLNSNTSPTFHPGNTYKALDCESY
jgi:hypothetical protein